MFKEANNTRTSSSSDKCDRFEMTVIRWSENWQVMRELIIKQFGIDESIMPPVLFSPDGAGAACAPGQPDPTALLTKLSDTQEESLGHRRGVAFSQAHGLLTYESAGRGDGATVSVGERPRLKSSMKFAGPTPPLHVVPSPTDAPNHQPHPFTLARTWKVARSPRHRRLLTGHSKDGAELLSKQLQDVILAIISAFVDAYAPIALRHRKLAVH
jgi:hypothetical protein